MVKETLHFQMAQSIMGNGKMAKSMAKADFNSIMEIFTKGSSGWG